MTLRVLRPTLLAAALLALAALLAAPAGALAAKRRTKAYPAQTNTTISIRGTRGWRLRISGLRYGKAQSVTVGLHGLDHETLSYNESRGRVDADGSMRVTLPGIGRIDVDYEPTKTESVHVSGPKNCTSPHSASRSTGVFRGTIEFHGEGDFTKVDRRSARGSLAFFPGQTCREPAHPKRQRAKESAEELGFELLDAQRKLGSGTLTFTALSHESFFGGSAPAEVEFTASYSRHRDGLWIDAGTTAQGAPEDFSLSAPAGTPSEATVEPPAPFKGAGTFTLQSPTTASWVGPLRVPVATLGTVGLTGSAFDAAICVDLECTKTIPPGTQIGFSFISALPQASSAAPGR